jgi:hypothetical protein
MKWIQYCIEQNKEGLAFLTIVSLVSASLTGILFLMCFMLRLVLENFPFLK